MLAFGRMEWWTWILVAVVGIVVLFAVMEAKAPQQLRAFERGLDRTEAGLDRTQRTLGGLGFTLIAFVTLPLLGFLVFGWLGLAVGLLIGMLLKR